MRLVLDTNVWISATIFETGFAGKLLSELEGKGARVFCSRKILAEYEKIILREFVEKRKRPLLKWRLPFLLAKIMRLASMVEPSEEVRVSRDPTDDAILECAIAAEANYIVSFDSDLLDLGDYAGIHIVHPKEMLRILLG